MMRSIVAGKSDDLSVRYVVAKINQDVSVQRSLVLATHERRVVFFDLDGTLTNTLDSLVRSVNLTLCEMGLPEITRDQCRQFVGNGARVLMEKALMASGARVFQE